MIAENPFDGLKGLNVRAVKERQAFIDREATYKLLNAAADPEWRAIIALARFGGVRVPSELQGLRWIDIDWTAGTMTVTSPKTEHCGKPSRQVPLFPELLPWLREAQDAAWGPDGQLPEFVVPRASAGGRVNLRTGLRRIIAAARLEPWPKLFVNLRASRATELVEHFPSHVAAEWLGHTEAVADEHYRQTTDQHYRRAASQPTGATERRLQGRCSQALKPQETVSKRNRPRKRKPLFCRGCLTVAKVRKAT